MKPVSRFEVHLIDLDPTRGSEFRKTRPCIIISPDEMNRHLRTVIVAPMTSTVKNYPTRVAVRFRNKDGEIVLDQLRSVDRERLVKRLGTIRPETAQSVCAVLQEMFALE